MKVQIKIFYETNKPDKAELKVSYDDGSALEMKGTEALIQLGLTDEQATKIISKITGNYVVKTEIETYKTENEQLKSDIKTNSTPTITGATPYEPTDDTKNSPITGIGLKYAQKYSAKFDTVPKN